MAPTDTARGGGNEPLPPQNLEAEEYVLSAMMLSGNAIDACQTEVRPSDFYRETHGLIFRILTDLRSIGAAHDVVSLGDELDKRGRLQEIGGPERLREIASLTAATANTAHHARIIREAAQLRDLTTIGNRISRLGWERGADTDTLLQQARDLVAGLDERRNPTLLTTEPWWLFEQTANNEIPQIITGLWPEAAFGFISGPPKKGKTWVALAAAVSIATGQPLFNHWPIPQPRPVIYVALEGHRAAIRARIGAIARGMGINPDQKNALQNLHIIFKPRGINLADPTWANTLRQAAKTVDAAIIFIDVMRAAARIKENDQAEFSNLRHNLQPLTDDGRAIAMLHHNVKLSDISKERDPGERMSGSGAMYGALDVGIYIVGSDDNARNLLLKFDLRDLPTPPQLNVRLNGPDTITYRDMLTITTGGNTTEYDLTAPPEEIRDYIIQNGGELDATTICAYFEISRDTLDRRRQRLTNLGITYAGGRGKTTTTLTYTAPTNPDHTTPNHPVATATANTARAVFAGAAARTAQQSQNNAVTANTANPPLRSQESADLQDFSVTANTAPLKGESRPAATTPTPTTQPPTTTTYDQALHDLTTWAWRQDSPIATLLQKHPTLPTHHLTELEHIAQTLIEEHEFDEPQTPMGRTAPVETDPKEKQ